MSLLQEVMERYLDVPSAPPGQTTAFRIVVSDPWPTWLPMWGAALVCAAIAGLIVWVYLRDVRTLFVRRRIALITLRLLLLLLVGLLLYQPQLVSEKADLPFLAILIDDSASMGFEDQYADPQLERSAHELLKATGYSTMTRWNLARAILTRQRGAFLKELLTRYRLQVYRFSDGAVPMGQSECIDADGINKLVQQLQVLAADGAATRPGPSLKQVLEDSQGSPPAAVILLSDGITSTGAPDRLTDVADMVRQEGVPIYAVGIGSDAPVRDVVVSDGRAPVVAFVGDSISFEASLTAHGFEGQTLTVNLKSLDRNAVLANTAITVLPGNQTQAIQVPYVLRQAGDYRLALEVKPLPDETHGDNNSQIVHVSVRDAQLRVLLADSAPRWEFRELKTLLEREKTIALHTVLQEADPQFAQQDATAKPLDGRFPLQRDQLFQYDVIILGDVDPDDLPTNLLQNLQDFVGEKGGGLIVIAGERHMPAEYRGTELEALIPIELDETQRAFSDRPFTDVFHPELTPAGLHGTPLFRFGDTDQASLSIWKNLPGFYWLFVTPRLKPGTIVLASHPTQSGESAKLPVLVLHRYGAGKVLFHATDELWRWRFRVGDLYYGRYWIQAIRYLSRFRLLGQTRSAELRTDRTVYETGDTIHLQLLFFNEQFVSEAKEKATVVMERNDGTRRLIQLTPSVQHLDVFEGQVSDVANGDYHLWVRSPTFPDTPPATDFQIHRSQKELQRRAVDRAELVQAARMTQGKFYTLNNLDRLADELPPGKPVWIDSGAPLALWNRWEVLLLFVCLISAEWILRNRWRLV